MCRITVVLHAWKLTFCDLTLTWPLLTTISRAPQYRPVTIQRCYKLKNHIYKALFGLSRRHSQKQ